MSVTPRVFVAGQVLTGTAAPYYTAPAGKKGIVKSASVTNTTGGVIALTVYRVANGQSPNTGNTIISARNVNAGEVYNCPELINKVLESNDFISAFGSGLSFDVSGAESVTQ